MSSILKYGSLIWQAVGRFPLSVLLFALASPSAVGTDACRFRDLRAYHEEADRFKQERLYVGQPYLRYVSNRQFVDYARSLTEESGRLFLHVENTVLKTLNDKAFQDKEISAASLNLYKTIYFDLFLKSPISEHLVSVEWGGGYNDSKSIRLKFDVTGVKDAPWLLKVVRELHKTAGTQFAEAMRDYPVLAQAYRDSANPVLKDPTLWHELGVGATPAEASLKARYRRDSEYKGRTEDSILFGPGDIKHVAHDIDLVEAYRQRLVDTFKDDRLISQGLPTPELVEILRIAQTAPEVVTHSDYRQFVRKFLYQRFGLNVNANEPIDLLQRYFRLGDKLAPSIFTPEHEPIELANLSKVDNGVWAFDVAGQNKRNLTGVFAALHFAAQAPKTRDDLAYRVTRALEETTNRQFLESGIFQRESDRVTQIMIQHGVIDGKEPHRSLRVGDELTYQPTMVAPPTTRAKVLMDLANNPIQGGLLRSSLQLQSYADGSNIRREERFEIISKAENLEKLLRRRVEGLVEATRIPESEMRELLISVNVIPLEPGKARVDVEIAHREKAISMPRAVRALKRIEDQLSRHDLMPHGWLRGKAIVVEQLLDEATIP